CPRTGAAGVATFFASRSRMMADPKSHCFGKPGNDSSISLYSGLERSGTSIQTFFPKAFLHFSQVSNPSGIFSRNPAQMSAAREPVNFPERSNKLKGL